MNPMNQMMSTKQVAEFLRINEKMVYSLIAEKGLPASKVTGKWLFPRHLVEQWVEINTLNYPKTGAISSIFDDVLIIAGSNDLLLDRAIHLFNTSQSEHLAVFANLGSMGGLRSLKRNRCHIASSHLLQDDEQEYNFKYADQELDISPAIVNFCRREQGILLSRGNPQKIQTVADLGKSGVSIVNRSLGTGTRLLLDRELQKAGIRGETIQGYGREVQGHLNVGLEILAGRADAGPGIRAVAGILNLDFIPLRWERYDLMVAKERFFDEPVQRFFNMFDDQIFRAFTDELTGYDLSFCGKLVFPKESEV